MSEHETMDWQRIGRELAAPFAPEEVEWRPAGKGGANAHAQLTAYIDGAAVMERLDSVVGPGAWEFRWEPLVMDKNILVAKGILAIYGVTKEDVGTASNWEPSKGCVSDALKRVAVQWGIGRYLRDIPQVSCQLDERGNIPPAMRGKLQEALRRRSVQAAPTTTATAQAAQAAQASQAEPEAQAAQAAPEDNAPTTLAELAEKRASQEVQRDLAAQISTAGHNTQALAEAWLEATVGRHIGAAALKSGTSSITLGEVKRALGELPPISGQRSRRQQSSQPSAS